MTSLITLGVFKTEIHIDLSCKYDQKGHSLIGYVDKYTPLIKFGLILRNDIKKVWVGDMGVSMAYCMSYTQYSYICY